jgi:hypothetical protein
MPTHVKRNSLPGIVLLAALLAIQPAAAQNAPAPAPAAAPSPAPAAPAPASGQPPAAAATLNNNITEVDSSTSTALDYLFNHKAQEGTTMKAGSDVASAIADKIKAVDVLRTPGLDDPIVRARFETYISLKEVPQPRIDEYFGKMKKISEMLRSGPDQDIFGAWKQLVALSDYEDLDAGISKELASRVENFWNTDKTKNGLEAANSRLRDNIATANHNADLDAQDLKEQEALDNLKNGNRKGGGGGNNSSSNQSVSNATNAGLVSSDADPAAAEAAVMPTMGQALQGKMDMTSEYLNLLEARFKIKINEIRETKMSDQDRMDFTDYIKTLYKDHRYYHVILAADFYRALFNEGDYPQDLTNQAVAGAVSNGRTAADGVHQVGKSLGVNNGAINALNQAGSLAGGNPLGGTASGDQDQPLSIADEVTSADEINNRVSQIIEVFRYKADKGEVSAAAEQLQEAFVGNEFHPALQGLPRDEKEKVGEFLTKVNVLKNQLEVRDFEQVEGQVAAIQKVATDFDATKPLALVNAIKLEARLRLGKARLLAQADNLTDAMKEFQTAAEEWPGNPDLNTSANTFFKTENNQNQATGDFDHLEEEQNWRAIFDRQLEFALAVKGDATREQQLKDALTKVVNAKKAEETANAMMMAGNVYGAWETIETASNELPDDTKLNKLLATLSERGADFVSALTKAREAESKKELGFSLNWYVNAQATYPASTIANDGIERISKQILNPSQGSGGASAQE